MAPDLPPSPVALRALLLVLLACVAGCASPEHRAKDAVAAGNYDEAADRYLDAAKGAACPQRGKFLMLRGEVLELDGQERSAAKSIDKAIELCPDFAEAIWARAQRAAAAGDRAQALADATRIKDVLPAAAELHSDLSMEVAVERGVRDRANQLVESLAKQLNVELGVETLASVEPATFARMVPYPLTATYDVQQSVRGDVRFDLKWKEIWSYRGDASGSTHTLVRTLELPPLDRDLPVTVRLTMSNQRLPMRFLVDDRGQVLEAGWLSRGPDRGMRPEMLRPEIEGLLKRRRVYDPGEAGRRAVGERWRGEDVRLVDGKPITVLYESEAKALESVRGIPTLHVASKYSAPEYSGTEDVWLHPETAVPVKVVRELRYVIRSDAGAQRWQEHTEMIVSAIAGSE